ncbi:hypothetical protein ACOJTA_11045 [Malaciobacter sp. WC5094]
MENKDIFNKLPKEAKEILIKEKYDIKKDPDNILKINPSSNHVLEKKLNEIRIKNIKTKFYI